LYFNIKDPRTGECKLSDSWADVEKPGPLNADCNNAN
jgi:hypothetical protein